VPGGTESNCISGGDDGKSDTNTDQHPDSDAITAASSIDRTSHTLVLLCLQRRSDDLAAQCRLRRASSSPRASLPWSAEQEARLQALATAANTAAVYMRIL
jgi:hypothetical protein